MKEYLRLILGYYDVMNNEDYYKASRYQTNTIMVLVLFHLVLFAILVALK